MLVLTTLSARRTELMAHLHQQRIEDIPLCISPDDTSFLQIKIASIEQEIASLISQISQLESQVQLKRQDLAAMNNVLAPIRRLPFELLSSIFQEFCLLDQSTRCASRRSVKAQITLSQVCFTWRKVALGTPRFWREIDVNLRRASSNSMREIQMVPSWLKRSGALSLDVSMVLHRRNYQSSIDVFNQLLPFCDRIRSLTLTLSLPCLSSFLSKQPKLCVLEKLDLTLHPDVTTPKHHNDTLKPHQHHQGFSRILNLHQLWSVKLKLPRSTYHDNQKSFLTQVMFTLPLPLNQLHSLHLELNQDGNYSFSDACSYLNILRNCLPTLVHCRLVRCPEHLRDALVKFPGPMTFSSLEFLSFEQWDDAEEARLVQLITVPALVTLRIDHSIFGGDDFTDFSKHLIEMEARSSFPLSTLELIRARMMCTRDLLAVLVAFSTVKHLKLCDCNLNTELLMRGLQICGSQTQGRKPIVPRLEWLYLVDHEVIPKGSEYSIVDMVESRTNKVLDTGVCFRRLTLAYECHQLSEVVTRLDELVDLDLKAIE
ncbi:hypothetical protein F5878DRAFT_720840 [Lentinula raphanica]|uniref:F-box domain-containing protein n=1 Tax=Lentinula raphanica TaxID=153919 RepID=A0AA38PKC3_9AGAR|nr:hypothetical protein F5878DRAFT_720840 [Lentinula raphanica]